MSEGVILRKTTLEIDDFPLLWDCRQQMTGCMRRLENTASDPLVTGVASGQNETGLWLCSFQSMHWHEPPPQLHGWCVFSS